MELVSPGVVGGRRWARPMLLGLLLAFVWILLGPAPPAAAHAYLVGSDPGNGEVVSDAPDEVVLHFNEPVRPVADRMQVVDPDGQELDLGDPVTDGPDVIIPVEGADTRGTYLVSYRVISADGHPIGGGLTFSVGVASEPAALPTAQDLEDPALRHAMSAARYAGYAGLILVIGPAFALAMLWPQRLPRQGLGRLVWGGVGLIVVGTLAGVWLQAPYSTGKAISEITWADIGDVLGSTYGQASLVRLAALAAAVWLLRLVVGGRASRTDLMLLGALGVLALSTWPASGHPIASPLPAVSVVVALVHLAAAAFWIGGLAVLAGFLLRRANERELGAILPVWSSWAATAVAALLLAGVVQAVIEVGSVGALTTTGYGRLLLFKLSLVAAVIVVAAYSRRLVRRRVAAGRPGVMRAAVAIEAGLLALVIAASAVLVQTTPARTEAAAEGQVSVVSDFTTTLDTELYSLQVTVEPAELGSNTLHLYAFTPQGEPLPVVEWGATAALPAAEVEPIDVPLVRVSDNHALGELSLPVAGEWEFRFTVRVSEVDQASVTVAVPINEP